MPSKARALVALLVVLVAVGAIFSPQQVAELLDRPSSTLGEQINLRATWGGLLLGVGLAIAFASTSSVGRGVISLVLWIMIGVGAARVTGFVLDGIPGAMQWVWLTVEVAIAILCVWILRKKPAKTADET